MSDFSLSLSIYLKKILGKYFVSIFHIYIFNLFFLRCKDVSSSIFFLHERYSFSLPFLSVSE